MDMNGEYRIAASRDTVWDALNNPDALKESISGCEELVRDGGDGFSAKVRAKVGPVSARFSGKVRIVDPDPPNGYRIEGEGTGGAAGFAKGGATVRLREDGADTILTYEANASVGGKLAQIGSRLIDGAAKKMADEFFAKFGEYVAKTSTNTSLPSIEAVDECVPRNIENLEVEDGKTGGTTSGEAVANGRRLWLWGIAAVVLVLGAAFFLL